MLGKLRKLFGRALRRPPRYYEEERRELEIIMGRPTLTLRVRLPKECEGKEEEFLSLSKKRGFLEDLEKLVRKHLKK